MTSEIEAWRSHLGQEEILQLFRGVGLHQEEGITTHVYC